jgi:hypothetical protein
LEIPGVCKGLKSLYEGMYFLRLLGHVLLLQNTWLHEKKPSAWRQGCHGNPFMFLSYEMLPVSLLYQCPFFREEGTGI